MSNQHTLNLLQITDTHMLGSRDGLLRGVSSYDRLQTVLADARQRFASAQGILLTGDLVQDDAAGYALIRESFQQSSVPVYCLPGNHDLPDAMRKELAGRPFVLDEHVVLGDWLLVMLNSWQENRAGGRLGEAQIDRLNTTLSQHAQLHTLVCLHHHPIAMRSDWLDQVGLEDADALRTTLSRHQQVRGVLWGHVHQAMDQYLQGVRYMATPATSVQFLPGSHEFAVDTRPAGYRSLQLGIDGSIASEVHWLDTLR